MGDRRQALAAEDFEPLIGQELSILFGDDRRLPVTLAEVRRLEGAPPGAPREAFAIVLRAAGKAYVPQQILRLEHENLGVLELFFVPLGPDPSLGGMRYEAIFT